MMKPRSSGIFRKYFSITAAVMLLSFTIMDIMLMLSVSSYWINQRQELFTHNAQVLARKASIVLSTTSVDAQTGQYQQATVEMVNLLLGSTKDSVGAQIFICNPAGEVIFCDDMLDTKTLQSGSCEHQSVKIQPEYMRLAMEDALPQARTTLGGTYEKRHFVAAKPLVVNGVTQGAVFITQMVNQEMLPYLLDMQKNFLLAAMAALLIAFVGIYWMTYQLTKPLSEMSQAAKQYAQGDFSQRVQIISTRQSRADDELNDLVRAFNAMASALAVLETSRRSFIANVSHELKTPMTTIGGFIDGILDGTVEPDRQKYYLSIVSTEVRRLSRLVTSMMNLSKMEAGELEINPKHFDIGQMIFDTLLTFEQVLDKKEVEIRGLDTIGNLFVWADEDMINQVVYNLIDNAVKFVDTRGHIEVSGQQENGRTAIRIRNSGDGISPEETRNIFERFYKVDKSRSYDVRGAGLGLYIVRSIVELHGGKIWAESELGKYAQFVFWLPTQEKPKTGAKNPQKTKQ